MNKEYKRLTINDFTIDDYLKDFKRVIDKNEWYEIEGRFLKPLYEQIINLQQENKQLKEKCEYLKEQKENKNKWFQLIADIGYDYDGFNKVESLKRLIDELVQYALNGRDNYDFEEILTGDSNE